jgi:hypothetical protein
MSTTLPRVPEPSPVEAAREAVGHTRRLLFPFRFELWLTLGLVAFLEQCGSGGTGGALPGPPPLGGFPDSASPPATGDLGGWFTAHLAVIVVVAAALLALAVAVVALVLWIGSRATFVYIEDVATGRGELTRPWKAHAEKAQSYFAWRFGLAAALFGSIGVLVVVGVSAAILIAKGGTAGAVMGALLLVAIVPAFLLVLLAGGLGALALRDFVAPLQMHTGEPCGAAVRRLIVLVRAYPLPFLLYVVLKVVFEMMRGMVLVLAACLTLCCILLPVVTQTALQPLFFFDRAWPLFFLRQMGHDLLVGSGQTPAGVGSSGGAEP